MINIKKRGINKKRNLSASNSFSDSDIAFFIDNISKVKPFPKLRDLRKILSPTLSLDKINAILKYLERSKLILIDLDGNIIWIKENNLKKESYLSDAAEFSEEFLKFFGKN